MTVTISADDLAERISAGQRTVVLDVRWTLMKPDGRDDYLTGHLPGAVYVDLDTELSDHSVTGAGRHPLPSPAALQDSARRWGVTGGDTVVVYDDWLNQAAARAWWLLRAAGVDALLLDGGWSGWQASGRPVETGDVSPAPGDVVITSLDGMATADADEVARRAQTGVVLDARAGERFRGEVEPLDPRAGHIPGARSVPTAQNVNADATFRGVDDLRQRFADAGVTAGDPPVVYCGSGVSATHQIAALAIAGHDAVLFPGSWSEWSNDPDRPVATGPES
jgi:thiosulfate/3-mercaptopyruvate sulfurtransferase